MQKILPSNLVKLIISLMFFGACLTTSNAFAFPEVTFSVYRIALDKKNAQHSLTLRNKAKQAARCTVGFTHYNILADGQFVLVQTAEETHNPASSVVRYSPSRVTIPTAGSQTIRVALKRSKDMKDGEYLSYLNLSCKDDLSNLNEDILVGLVPTVSYNIPIVVRVGELNASVSLSDAKLSSNRLTVNINRTGSRSVYGSVTITDVNSGELLGKATQISVYTQVNKESITVPLTKKVTGPVLISFEESVGDKPLQASLIL